MTALFPSQQPPPTPVRFVGGSVVPVVRDGSVVLGSQRCRSRLGRHYFLWDTLGGGVHGGETVEDAAAREFAEESLSVVPLMGVGPDALGDVQVTAAAVSAILKARAYVARVDMGYIAHGRLLVHTVFFVQARAWGASVLERFGHVRSGLLAVRDAMRMLRPPTGVCAAGLPVPGCVWGGVSVCGVLRAATTATADPCASILSVCLEVGGGKSDDGDTHPSTRMVWACLGSVPAVLAEAYVAWAGQAARAAASIATCTGFPVWDIPPTPRELLEKDSLRAVPAAAILADGLVIDKQQPCLMLPPGPVLAVSPKVAAAVRAVFGPTGPSPALSSHSRSSSSSSQTSWR